MAATLDSTEPLRDALAVVAARPAVEPASSRVKSFSPHAYDMESNKVSGSGEKPPANNHHHVELLHAASDRLIALLKDANGAVDRLEASTFMSRDNGENVNAASLQLQERLQLSAAMLKAFQAQIARVEESIGTLKSHDQQVRATEAVIEQRLKRFESSFEERLNRFMEKLNQVAQTAISRIVEVASATESLRDRSSKDESRSAEVEIETKPRREAAECTEVAAPLQFKNWAKRG